MKTTIKCDVCGCETKFDEYDHVKIDSKRKKENNDKKIKYEYEIDEYKIKRENVIKKFKKIIEIHNKNIYWYSFKTKWLLTIDTNAIIIQEKNMWSYEYVKKIKTYHPRIFLIKERYITCPICNDRHYFY